MGAWTHVRAVLVVADRIDPEDILECSRTPPHHFFFLLLGHLGDVFVHVAVVHHLVSFGDNALAYLWKGLRRMAGNPE